MNVKPHQNDTTMTIVAVSPAEFQCSNKYFNSRIFYLFRFYFRFETSKENLVMRTMIWAHLIK